MTGDTQPNARSAALFAAIGLAMGAIIGWLAANSWLGIGFLVILALLVIGTMAELDVLADIGVAISEPVWKTIARAGEKWAGVDPDQPVPGALRAIFALGFAASLIATLMIELPFLRALA
ncbi:hypothetical protein FNJ84_00110 [Paracoccus sp. M683]|uniref:hypothetical protein n=1 Tax=Paracoccus sp. M683 TaxID=2594268 RepID=UPI00117CE67E|nr:hypothetical protein [Paracoccus sp. M683]TRW99126.1 hypothetical protein FNJ84_00110 [Paracoccus sp. M683]